MNTRIFLVAVAALSATGSFARGGEESTTSPNGPLIFSLRQARPLGALLRHGRIAVDTASLVRLHGGAAWWQGFPSAYDALASLDVDHDGWLSGRELKGFGVWRDRNRNGVVDSGEVISIESARIDAISTRATSKAGVSPANPTGIVLRSGRTLPTYHWIR